MMKEIGNESKEKNMAKEAVRLTDEQLAEVSGGDLTIGGVWVSDGNCKKSVNIVDGLCRFHPTRGQDCNTTCKYYCDTRVR